MSALAGSRPCSERKSRSKRLSCALRAAASSNMSVGDVREQHETRDEQAGFTNADVCGRGARIGGAAARSALSL